MDKDANKEKSKLTTILNSEKSCVAWFKLAELVTRKEKEKALNLYRLLAHSFEDRAYALQLEGDMLWALEDNLALEKYSNAAFLYKKEKRIVCATAVYEHLFTLQPKNYDYLSKLIILYVLLLWKDKFEYHYKILLKSLDDGFITQEFVFNLSKKVINLALGIDSEKIEDKNCEKISRWILGSLSSALVKTNSNLKEEIKKYFSQQNLDFNS